MYQPIVPRRALWPEYMSHEAWQDLADVIDEVFGPNVDMRIDALRYLRALDVYDERRDGSPNGTTDPVQTKILAREMLQPLDFSTLDPVTERLRLQQLGLRIQDPTILNDEAVVRLVKHIGQFWYSKGLGSFIDFISYMLNVPVVFSNLWTQNYVTFFEEADPVVGTPVWEGGTWYPTTHIRVKVAGEGFTPQQIADFAKLFYDIANYNLVLESISSESWIQILPASQYTDPIVGSGLTAPATVAPAHITSLAFMQVREDYILPL